MDVENWKSGGARPDTARAGGLMMDDGAVLMFNLGHPAA
jgi:hypothetical protein